MVLDVDTTQIRTATTNYTSCVAVSSAGFVNGDTVHQWFCVVTLDAERFRFQPKRSIDNWYMVRRCIAHLGHQWQAACRPDRLAWLAWPEAVWPEVVLTLGFGPVLTSLGIISVNARGDR